MEKDGITVIKALSNDEALDILSLKSKNIDGIITGVSRNDRGIFYPKAGLDFIIKAKELKYEIPIFVLCSERNIKEYYTALKAAGAIEATSSSLELVSLLHIAGINCNTKIEKSHIAHLDAMKDGKRSKKE